MSDPRRRSSRARRRLERRARHQPDRHARHRGLKKLAAFLGTTVGRTVGLAVRRRLRQDEIGAELRGDLAEAETDWLDADLG